MRHALLGRRAGICGFEEFLIIAVALNRANGAQLARVAGIVRHRVGEGEEIILIDGNHPVDGQPFAFETQREGIAGRQLAFAHLRPG